MTINVFLVAVLDLCARARAQSNPGARYIDVLHAPELEEFYRQSEKTIIPQNPEMAESIINEKDLLKILRRGVPSSEQWELSWSYVNLPVAGTDTHPTFTPVQVFIVDGASGAVIGMATQRCRNNFRSLRLSSSRSAKMTM